MAESSNRLRHFGSPSCSPMGCQILNKYTCLPITALCIIPAANPYLLAGEGGSLHLFELRTNVLLESVQVFGGQAIHDIHVSSYHADNSDTEILVSGGSLVAILRLSFSKPSLLGQPSLYDVNDWVLKACYQGQGDNTGLFTLITANNSLLAIETPVPNHSCTPMRLGQGPRTFLYSADICASGDHAMILAGGSAFGEIVVWSCHRHDFTSNWTSTPLHRIPAHKGSIFGVCFSPLLNIGATSTRLIVSCSDDRQIHVRDLGIAKNQQLLSANGPIRDTGFGSAPDKHDELVAATWGHQSRIWGVGFVSSSEAIDHTMVKLISSGEDATCQIWKLCFDNASSDGNASRKMSLMYVDRHHSGKNVWSVVRYSADTGVNIISGGADGSVWKRRAPSFTDALDKIITIPFTRIREVCSSKLQSYMIVDDRQVLVLTASGNLLLHESPSTWQVIKSPSNSKVIKLCTNCPAGTAIVAVENGLGVWRPRQGLQLIEAALPFGHSVASLHLARMESLQPIPSIAAYLVVNLADSSTAIFLKLDISDLEVTVSYTRSLSFLKGCVGTASHFFPPSRTLIVGFRSGALAFFHIGDDTSNDVTNAVYVPCIHGSEAITSIRLLEHLVMSNKGGWKVHILTTGRDGTYAIHEATLGPENIVQLSTAHRSSPPLGTNIEGAHLDDKTGQILIFGFKSTNFVVWNETEQYILASIDCGGAHRSWDYRLYPSHHGRFVWTKAGTFNSLCTGSDKPESIQRGGHGREIKAVAVFPHRLFSSRLKHYYLVASGAEDTEIRLFAAFTSAESGQLTCKSLAVLRDHTTGLQRLSFSANQRYLVSAGGAEQLYIWRLSFGLPYAEVGVVLEGKMPRTDDDADVRIMDFCVLDSAYTPYGASGDVTSIAAAYSNGKVKVIQYREGSKAGEGSFLRLHEIHFGSFCLTQIHALDFKHADEHVVITAGTNGYLNLFNLKNQQDPCIPPDRTHVQKVHQNSIQCLQSVKIQSDIQLVVTGGDDNALGLTVQRGRATNISQTESHSLLIPRAHAAALTALHVITNCDDSSKFQAIIVTAGNDQKIKVWKIGIPLQQEEQEGRNGLGAYSVEAVVARMSVRKVYETCTFVADISNMVPLQPDAVSDAKGGIDLVVVGVGMEVIELMLV